MYWKRHRYPGSGKHFGYSHQRGNRLSAKKKDPPGLTKRRLYQLQHLAKVTLKRLHADSYSSNILQRKKPKASSSMPHLILLFSSCFTFLDYKTVAKINTFFKHCTLLIKMCRTKQQILCKHIRLINNRRAAKVVTWNQVLVIIKKNHPNQKRIYTASTKEDILTLPKKIYYKCQVSITSIFPK